MSEFKFIPFTVINAVTNQYSVISEKVSKSIDFLYRVILNKIESFDADISISPVYDNRINKTIYILKCEIFSEEILLTDEDPSMDDNVVITRGFINKAEANCFLKAYIDYQKEERTDKNDFDREYLIINECILYMALSNKDYLDILSKNYSVNSVNLQEEYDKELKQNYGRLQDQISLTTITKNTTYKLHD